MTYTTPFLCLKTALRTFPSNVKVIIFSKIYMCMKEPIVGCQNPRKNLGVTTRFNELYLLVPAARGGRGGGGTSTSLQYAVTHSEQRGYFLEARGAVPSQVLGVIIQYNHNHYFKVGFLLNLYVLQIIYQLNNRKPRAHGAIDALVKI